VTIWKRRKGSADNLGKGGIVDNVRFQEFGLAFQLVLLEAASALSLEVRNHNGLILKQI
jgi:hypothetical protein